MLQPSEKSDGILDLNENEVDSSSETSVSKYQLACRHMPQELNFRKHSYYNCNIIINYLVFPYYHISFAM